MEDWLKESYMVTEIGEGSRTKTDKILLVLALSSTIASANDSRGVYSIYLFWNGQ